jgi:hypothetical protein
MVSMPISSEFADHRNRRTIPTRIDIYLTQQTAGNQAGAIETCPGSDFEPSILQFRENQQSKRERHGYSEESCSPPAPSWRSRPVCPEILIDFNFDSSVLGATFCGLVVCDRFSFAESLPGDPAALHSLLHHIIPNRHPAPIR